MLLHLCVMVWVGYIKASDKARNVSPTPHISRSLSSTKSNGALGRDENLGVSPTTPLESNRTSIRRPCPTKPTKLVLPVRIRGKHTFTCGQTLTRTLDALFWEAIFSMDITSAESLSSISTLVHSPSKITVARSLRGGNAERMIDLIDRVRIG